MSGQLSEPTIHPDALIATGTHIFGDVQIGARTFILFGVVIRAELERIVIGSETNVQDNTVIHADEGIPCHIGDRVTIGHAAVVHGATIRDRGLLGIGARALNGSVVGEGAWLAAGSVLPEGRDIPPWTLAMGTPAKPIRELTADEIRRADEGVEIYLALADSYQRVLSERHDEAQP